MRNVPPQVPCSCGRSPSGNCTGLHKMTNEQYQKYMEERQRLDEEASKAQLLKG